MPDERAEQTPTSACPRCRGRFVAVPMDHGAVLHSCNVCSGLFVPPRAWNALMQNPALVPLVGKRVPRGRALTPEELVRMLRCPCCGGEMERGRYAASSGVVVDVCARHGAWLDGGELDAIARLASGKSGGGGPPDGLLHDSPHLSPLARAIVAEAIAREVGASREAIASPSSTSSWTKGVFLAAIFVLIVGFVVLRFFVGKGGVMQQHEDSAKAAESATKALGAPP